MRRDRNAIDPKKPALIVTYGSCPGKVRQLDQQLLVIGRAPACDLVLNSPEVSPVHCLIVRTAGGWLLRNTNPRVGTQVNGTAVQDARLADDDSLQIGTFSFKVHLPPGSNDAAPLPTAPVAAIASVPTEDPRMRWLEAARERAIRLALRLRRRLRHREPMLAEERNAYAQRIAELEQRSQEVDARQRECQDLMNLLEEHEAEVTVQRQSLAEAVAEFEASRRRAEADIQKRRDQIKAREQELERLRTEAVAAVAPTSQALQELEQRKAELDNYALQLREARANGAGTPNEEELDTLRAENDRLRRQGEEVDALRNDLESREDELERLRHAEAEWRDMQTALADLKVLRQENERLRTDVGRRDQDLRDRAKLQAGADELRRERDSLREQLQAATAEQERLRQLAEQEPEPPDMVELVKDNEEQAKAHEEELKQLREQLEAARADLKRLEVQQSQAKPPADHPADDADLRAENDRLHKQVIELTEGMEEKTRLQTRLDEQRRQLVILRDQLREKEAELRRSQAQAPAGSPEQGDLVVAIETLLKENDEYRERLHVQAQQLKEKIDLQSKVEALQAEISVLRAQLPGQGDAEPGAEVPTALMRPSKFLLRENEALKARLAEQEAAVKETERLKSEIVSLRGRLEAQPNPPAPLSESSWHELFAAGAGNESLLKETEALRDRLAEQQKQLAELAQLREENSAFRAAKEARAEPSVGTQATVPAPGTSDDRHKLKARITELEAHLKDRETRLNTLQGQNAKLKEGIDEDNLAAVEAKLTRERKVILDERATLEQAQTRVQRERKELDATVHSTELQLAKERVQITREWAELNKKREEFRMEMEKEKRDSIRDNLDRVRKMKEEAQAKRKATLSPLSNSRAGERKPEVAKTPE
jgi:chromosome segregation ATPase